MTVRSAERRLWKLALIRALTAKGHHVATVRRTVGSRLFNALLDAAYETAPDDPVRAAEIVHILLHERYGEQLARPVAPWSRK